MALILAGAALVAWSAALHLYLWTDYFHRISTIGPLFMIQGVVGVGLAAAIVALRRAVLALAGAMFLASTAGGLLLSVWVGLFGYHEHLRAPYAGESLVVEFVGTVVLIVAAAVLHFEARERRTTLR